MKDVFTEILLGDGNKVRKYINLDGVLHRVNGPALLAFNSKRIVYKQFYLNGILHRTDGPANIEFHKNGKIKLEEYYNNYKLHNENGPAIIKYDKKTGKVISEYYYALDEPFNSLKELQFWIKHQILN